MKSNTSSTIINVIVHNNKGNVNVDRRDASNIIQSVNISPLGKNILDLLERMKRIIEKSTDIDAETKENIEDELDIIKTEIESKAPKESIIRKTIQRLETTLMSVKNMTAVSTLLIDLKALQSQSK